MDLFNDIQDLMQELTISIKNLRKHGNELAIAERNYKVIWKMGFQDIKMF